MTKRVADFDATMLELGGIPCVFPGCKSYSHQHPNTCAKHRCGVCTFERGLRPLIGWGTVHYWKVGFGTPIPDLTLQYPTVVCPTQLYLCGGDERPHEYVRHCTCLQWVQRAQTLCIRCQSINKCDICDLRVKDMFDAARRERGFCASVECARVELCANAEHCPSSADDVVRYVTAVEQTVASRPLFCSDCEPHFLRCMSCRDVYQLRDAPRKRWLSKYVISLDQQRPITCIKCLVWDVVKPPPARTVFGVLLVTNETTIQVAALLQWRYIRDSVIKMQARFQDTHGMTATEARFYLFERHKLHMTREESKRMRENPTEETRALLRDGGPFDESNNLSVLFMNCVTLMHADVFRDFISRYFDQQQHNN